MANQEFNVCKNWGLRCYEQKVSEKAVILNCTMNHKVKDSDSYTAPVYIKVVAAFSTCEIAQDDYAKSFIDVDGRFAVDEFENKEGKKVPTMTIFASKVAKHQK